MKQFILSIDQGTTGSTAVVTTHDGQTVGAHSLDFPQHFPQPGWVEHEPEDLWSSVRDAVKGALKAANITGADIAGIGITNQRETTLLWDRKNSKPVYRAIVWQCRRTAEMCEALKSAGHEEQVRQTTGLVLDPYFSGTKLRWLLDHVEGARARAEAGELAFGTVDSFLVWRLSSGDTHITDATNASRTMLASLHTGDWDADMLNMLGIPAAVLPRVVDSAGVVAKTRGLDFLPDGIPIAGIAGDQQAALFGQGCVHPGDAKCTYGTGAFALINTGDSVVRSSAGLLSTVAWRLNGQLSYALEGSSFVAGAAVQWLRDGLGLISDSAEVEKLAREVPDAGGVLFVPALTGLGAPYWRPEARGMISGLTRGTTRAHVARATLEGIAHGVTDLLGAMAEGPTRVSRLRVDGGAAANDLLMQLQSDYANVVVERPVELESTARGAALLAAVGLGLLTITEASLSVKPEATFQPISDEISRDRARNQWQAAIVRC